MTESRKRGSPRSRFFSIPGAVPLFVSLIVVAILATMYAIGRRASLLRDTQSDLLFNATLTAQGFDANLRIADIVLENMAEDFASGRIDLSDGESAVDQFIGHAHDIGVVDNIYLLDPDWNVGLTAFERIEPKVATGPDLRSRLRADGGPEVLIVDCPAEGGSILALLRPLSYRGGTYFIAALFSGFDIEGRLVSLRSGGRGRIALQDRVGAELFIGGTRMQPLSVEAPTLEVSSRFPSYPAKVLVSVAREDILSRWRTEVYFILVAMLVFSAMMLALGYYKVILRRRRRQMDALESALETDTTLFREINHRIKNNLVVVESVLNLGVGQYEDGSRSVRQILESARDRVHSIALVHELLYRGQETKDVLLKEYIAALREAIGSAYDPAGRIEHVLDIDGMIELNFDIAVPCGMILSELITNSYKYAFPGERRGRICVSARRTEGNDVELVVQDDGVGISSSMDFSRTDGASAHEKSVSSGLGMMLVSGLTDQIDGSIERDAEYTRGVRWVLRFPDRPKNPQDRR